MESTLTLETPRLKLLTCSAPVARIAAHRHRQIESLTGYRVHEDWPSMEICAYLPFYAAQLEADPSLLGWGIWLMIHCVDRMIVGDVGFKGKPDATGTVDIGYGIVPSYRRQGYTFEAAAALRDWALAQPGVRRITGDCLPENTGSARILEKLGMHRIGMSPVGLILWEMTC